MVWVEFGPPEVRKVTTLMYSRPHVGKQASKVCAQFGSAEVSTVTALTNRRILAERRPRNLLSTSCEYGLGLPAGRPPVRTRGACVSAEITNPCESATTRAESQGQLIKVKLNLPLLRRLPA